MKTLDLYGKKHSEIGFLVDRFIRQNLDNLPIKIITHTFPIEKKTRGVIQNYNLTMRPENEFNLGAWIVSKLLRPA